MTASLRTWVAGLSLAVAGGYATAQDGGTPAGTPAPGTAAAGMQSDEALRRQLLSQADAWDKAIVARDRAGIEANMDEDFLQIRDDGSIVGGREFLEAILSPDLRIDPYRVEDMMVRIYGDTAQLIGRIRMTGAYKGKPFTDQFRYIDTYVRRHGRWRVVSVQITGIPAPK